MDFCCLILGIFTFVQLNCENLFDCVHDSLKADTEFTAEGDRHWTETRYWNKLNDIGRTILSCGDEAFLSCGGEAFLSFGGETGGVAIPDMAALCEVENDRVMRDLTKRSLLRNAGYEYIVTSSPDVRGIDVALLYRPSSFRVINNHSFRVIPLPGMRPTRDILYVSGTVACGDTLHVFVVHAPSRYGGERRSRPYRRCVAERLCAAVDSLRGVCADAKIIIAGDFNDTSGSKSLAYAAGCCAVSDISAKAVGCNGARGSYKYMGKWESLDHILVSNALLPFVGGCFVNDAEFLLEEDKKYDGVKPFRTFNGRRYNGGGSDHLPVVACFRLP